MSAWVDHFWSAKLKLQAKIRRQRLPDFFICGAARSGTTSLWQYLRQHPGLFMPTVFELKEPSFFCESYGMKNWKDYLSLFAGANASQRLGEASGPYLTSPESPGLIRAVIPQSQIIILLRNPAERAFSLYKWMQENGYERLSTFAEALEAESKSRFGSDHFQHHHGQYYPNFLYFHSGLYAEQVQRFFDTFGRDQVRVLIFEEFVREPQAHLKRLFEFLRVDPSFEPKVAVHNATAPRPGEFGPAVRSRLLEQYAPSIHQLETVLGRPVAPLWA